MLHAMKREAWVTGAVALVAVALSAAIFGLMAQFDADSGDQMHPPSVADLQPQTIDTQGPGTLNWQRTGEYKAEHEGIQLLVHSLTISPDRTAILYSIVSPAVDKSSELRELVLTDDRGEQYEFRSHTILGTELGVTAGLIVAEPYKVGGETLALEMHSSPSDEGTDAQAGSGTWRVVFMRNEAPGSGVDYWQNSKIAPDVLVEGDVTLAKAGTAGPNPAQLLIRRGSAESAVYGDIVDLQARRLDAAQFQDMLEEKYGVSEFEPPLGWLDPELISTP